MEGLIVILLYTFKLAFLASLAYVRTKVFSLKSEVKNAHSHAHKRILIMPAIMKEVYGNGNAFIYRIFYSYIFKCSLHQHMSISDLILPTQPMKSWNSTKTRPAHRALYALLFAISQSGFFNVPQGYEHWSVVRRGLRFIVLIREE